MTKSKTRSLNIVGIWIKEVSIKWYLGIYSKLIFRSAISRAHIQSKIIYLYYIEMRSLKTVKKLYDVAK